MAESLHLPDHATKEERYHVLLPQLEALVDGESDLIANIGNLMAALHQTFDFFWVGVYFVKGEDLVLGPFQGPIACTRIKKGKGVCGTSWSQRRTLIVPDVEAFAGHIACSSDSKSEIVVPVLDAAGEVLLVIDVDSDRLNNFDETDRLYLEKLASLISNLCRRPLAFQES